MSMPYTIRLVDGPGENKTPFKVYPSGYESVAAPEELEAWLHLQAIEEKLKVAEAKLLEVQTSAPPPMPSANGRPARAK